MQDERGETATTEDAASPRQAWTAPKLIALDLLAKAEKLSYNTEAGTFSAIS